jgi:hypothetical protein
LTGAIEAAHIGPVGGRFAWLGYYLWTSGLVGVFAWELLKNHWRHGYWDIAGAAVLTFVFWLLSFGGSRFLRMVHGDPERLRE